MILDKELIKKEAKEGELLIRYRKGDRDAFNEVVGLYADPLYTFIRRFVRNPRVVEDVFQETFLHLYTNQDSIDTDHSLRSRLYVTAAQKAQKAMKKGYYQSGENPN